MKEVIIELDDMYSEVLSITAIGKHGNITNISTKAVELSKGAFLKFDGEKWTQKKSKHTGVVLEDENKEVASDLISRSAAIERFIEETEESGSPLFHINTIKRILQDIETAYNVDAVVEELKSLSNAEADYYYASSNDVIDRETAIEIVREGGVKL